MSFTRTRLLSFGDRPMAVSADATRSYAELVAGIDAWQAALADYGIGPGSRVALITDYHVDSVGLLLALIECACIVIPMSADDHSLFDERLTVAQATHVLTVPSVGLINPQTVSCEQRTEATERPHPLLATLVEDQRAGMVIFTSGSTGKGKAVLLDYARMVERFADQVRPAYRTLLFLKLDHIGGINTLLSVLFNGGTVVTCASRGASEISACIERHAVELLPTTPSFLTMFLMSRAYRGHDLSSLRVITYGTEVMPASTLDSLHRTFPQIQLKQTYGLSELGILSTQSRGCGSRWMKIGGDGFELDVREGVLWIRSRQAMLGYLNAPSPFDAEGWYNTGDRVEVDGEYYQVLGRESEIINVAGEKVFPAEIESFLLTLGNVRDVLVREKRSPVVGQMIWAEFLLEHDEDPAAFKRRVIDQCQQRLAPFKVPGFISIARGDSLVGSRFKKIRAGVAPTETVVNS
ncbi:class I adenylate-forming enzyme family protein [Aquimonas sp.]|jgi:acyl-CoA synthetase (AMP-forming)/AMP-acid ligase II|uniref:class I adenylate-forming enzyme family protein n=1 Tax=Aquimonas sp. TaxID=1872588 RepID=UPI0037C06EC2